jgi:hypothetical protein
LVGVDSVAAPASSQFGAPPFLPDGPLSRRSLPEPSGSVEDGDNFDSSIPPPDDCYMASNDDTYSFDYPYGDDLSSTSLPIEHHPDFSNVGAHLDLAKNPIPLLVPTMTTTMTTTTTTASTMAPMMIISHHRPSMLMTYPLAHLHFLDLYNLNFHTTFVLSMTPDSSPPTKPCCH